MISIDSEVKRNNEVFTSEIDEEVVMMNVDTGRYFGMDDVGSRIWKLLKERIRVKEIVNTLLKEYDVSEEECTNDVIEFLNELKNNNLLQITEWQF